MFEGFAPYTKSSPQTKETMGIVNYFGTQLPNMLFNNDDSMDFKKLTGSANVRSKTSEVYQKSEWNKGGLNFGDVTLKDRPAPVRPTSTTAVARAAGATVTSSGTSSAGSAGSAGSRINASRSSGGLAARAASAASAIRSSANKQVDLLARNQAKCEAVGNGDQYDHLSSLASKEDTQARMRCGWVYNTANPDSSRGAYGGPDGPVRTTASGLWMWDLKAAKERHHTDICKGIQSCSDVEASLYKQRCGWCASSGKAVPVVNGKVAYPYNDNTNCPANQLTTSVSRCPAPPPITDPNQPKSPADTCRANENGSIPRDCLLQKVITAGCTDNGALAQALRSGSDNDYTNVLRDQNAFKIFQLRAAVPMNETGLKTGKITITDALNDFKRVNDQSASEAITGLKAAARDLCLNKGELDNFDFCSEIKDTETGPFTLDCLQNSFLRSGGQKAGSHYPTQGNIKQWNSLPNWGAVKKQIQLIFQRTRSADRKTQEQGMMEYYGIRLRNKQKPQPGGLEMAWKENQVITSCERPLPIPDGYTHAGCVKDDDGFVQGRADSEGWNMGEPPENNYVKVANTYWNGFWGGGKQHLYWLGQTVEECKKKCNDTPDCLAAYYEPYKSACTATWSIHAGNRIKTNADVHTYVKKPLRCPAPFDNPEEEVSGWKYKGCYSDGGGRTLPHRFPNTASTAQCIAWAKEKGFSTIGRQYHGECWAGNASDWNKYGFAGCCEKNGGAWTQQIYTA
jgi:hypothetical protein